MNYEDLTPEQQAKAKACKTKEELNTLANEEGFQLSDDELEGIAGGEFERKKCSTVGCPHYGRNSDDGLGRRIVCPSRSCRSY